MTLIRVRDKAQITLPAKLRREVGIKEGDYLEARVEGNTIVLAPQDILARFPVVELAEEGKRWLQEGLDDLEAGRVYEHESVEALIEHLHNEPEDD
ncbi:MAG: AbrB/MazE/SpoVT family DNA-binding domain-containing protein [Armatimonadetes bacterium]|nr:AbrB/MazE/SpoVT family DNA-binding domain-containing protein [Armatimonadota bacterium]